MLLERQLWPEAFSRRRGGYLDRRPDLGGWCFSLGDPGSGRITLM
jgi:hypothetical protein